MTSSNALGLHRWLSCWLMLSSLAGVMLSPTVASAQVELRCPQGWTTAPPIAQGAEGQRPLVSCRKDPLFVGGLQLDARVAPGSDSEAAIATQLLVAVNFPPPDSRPQLRDETFGTVRGRVLTLSAQGEGPGGTSTRVTGVVALIPVGESTVVLRAVSTSSRVPAMTGLREIVAAIVGLDGAPPQWRVGLPSCPRPLSRGEATGVTPNGLRLAATCEVESEGKSVEVLESRLPVRTLAEARAAIDFYRQAMERQFSLRGGTVTMDEPTPITVQGTQGFYAVIHGTVTAQEAPNAPPQQLRIDRAVTVVPLDNGGHAELLATVANPRDPSAVRSLTEAVIAEVKLDGSYVTGLTTSASSSDGGVSAPGERAREQRRSNFDPNAPIPDWSSATVERPRVSQPARQKSSCGCSTPGAVDFMGAWWTMGLIAGALTSRKRSARVIATRRVP